MAMEPSFDRQAFLQLAKEAGLDIHSPHMNELFSYTQVVLTSLKSLHDYSVAGFEPDMAFSPPRDQSG